MDLNLNDPQTRTLQALETLAAAATRIADSLRLIHGELNRANGQLLGLAHKK